MTKLFLVATASLFLGGCFYDTEEVTVNYDHLISSDAIKLEQTLTRKGILPSGYHDQLKEKHVAQLAEANKYYSDIIEKLTLEKKRHLQAADREILDTKIKARSSDSPKALGAGISDLNKEKIRKQSEFSDKIKIVTTKLSDRLTALNQRYLSILKDDFSGK